MFVLVVSNLYPPDVLGGYELLAQDIVTTLAGRGHRVEVLTTRTDASQGTETVTRTLRLARPFGSAPGSDRLRHLLAYGVNRAATRRLLRERGLPDVALIMSLRRLGLAPLRGLQEAGVATVVTVNDDWPLAYAKRSGAGVRSAVEAVLFAYKTWDTGDVSEVVYLSDAVRRAVWGAGVLFPSGTVLPQGVDLRRFAPRLLRPVAAAPELLFVGRLHPSKAPEVALEALAVLRGRGLDAHLRMAGEADDVGYLRALRALADELGVAAQVEWLGKVAREELPDVYSQADVLLFASRLAHEGQGLTYLEAMASGVAVVAYPSGGALEFLDRFTDAVGRPRELTGECFADEVMQLYCDEGLTARRVEAGLRVVREHGSLETYGQALEAILQRVTR
jgi:glycosyltransferase involved in cell wall biosynthesis